MLLEVLDKKIEETLRRLILLDMELLFGSGPVNIQLRDGSIFEVITPKKEGEEIRVIGIGVLTRAAK